MTASRIRKRRTQTERKESTRAKLESAAFEVLAERGFEGLTVDAIAQQSGMSRGALGMHFATKDELLEPLVVMSCARAQDAIDQCFATEKAVGLAGLKGAMAALVQRWCGDDSAGRALNALLARAHHDETTRGALGPRIEELEAVLGMRAAAMLSAAGLGLRGGLTAGRLLLIAAVSASVRAGLEATEQTASASEVVQLLATSLVTMS
ncbi:MAG: helix-turn-helix domain-containing protein [Deltaproteobacteria bacterium]|nr:helix-turn-helix domain-containing protein [Deltaproteobacteria bacterium]